MKYDRFGRKWHKRRLNLRVSRLADHVVERTRVARKVNPDFPEIAIVPMHAMLPVAGDLGLGKRTDPTKSLCGEDTDRQNNERERDKTLHFKTPVETAGCVMQV